MASLTWSWHGTFLRPTAIYCCRGPRHWDTHPRCWLVRSCRCHCWCIQWCPWLAWLRYPEGARVLQFDIANGLLFDNTWFRKRDSHIITYSSGWVSTQIDYIPYRNSFRQRLLLLQLPSLLVPMLSQLDQSRKPSARCCCCTQVCVLQAKHARFKALQRPEEVLGSGGVIRHSNPKWWWCFPYCQTDGPCKLGRYGCGFVCNDADKLVRSAKDKMKTWIEHYVRVLNVEFEWKSNELPEVPPTAAPPAPPVCPRP